MAPNNSMTQILSVSSIPRLLGHESFKSDGLWTPPGNRGVFGGQVMGQALMAAVKTVEGKDLHSQHCYFLLPCNSQLPLTFIVERLRDGPGYAARSVHAIQSSKTIFILMASFAPPPRPLPDIPVGKKAPDVGKAGEYADNPFITRYQAPMPTEVSSFTDVDNPDSLWQSTLSTMNDFGVRFPDTEESKQAFLKERGGPIVAIQARPQSGKHSAQRAIWFKPILGADEKFTHNEIRAMLGYITDFQTVAAAGRTVGLSGTSLPKVGMLATIDHTIHYYPFPPDYDPSSPLLHVLDAVVVDVGVGRGYVRGRVYTDKGVLIATTSQEGVVRASAGDGKKPRSENARL